MMIHTTSTTRTPMMIQVEEIEDMGAPYGLLGKADLRGEISRSIATGAVPWKRVIRQDGVVVGRREPVRGSNPLARDRAELPRRLSAGTKFHFDRYWTDAT